MTTFRLASRLRAVPRPAVPTAVRPVRGAVATVAPAADSAVPVPWRVVARSEAGVVEIEHRGDTPLRAVRFSLAGGGLLGLSLPRTVLPGERLRVVLRGISAEGALGSPDAMLVLRWFQPDGTELLWPVAL